MQLKTYRSTHRLTLLEIMARLKEADISVASPSTVQRHEKGVRLPDIQTIEAYRRITKGEVTYDDWAVLEEQTRARRSQSVPNAKEAQAA